MGKNYDPATDRFRTQWAEINVSCEACHGPGSRHMEWVNAKQAGKPAADDGAKGLTARLDERRGVAWTLDAAAGNAVRSKPRDSDREIEVCAQCHSRRSQIAEGYEAGKSFLDYYRPGLLTRPMYHADGQQRDEVYNWGSFLQSKMYAHGVTCSDCHDPHSGKLRVQGNAVCATCHLPAKYDTAAHHHHKPGTTGASCAACHMPTATYMVVDPRHDHSLRVPRPDLSVKLGTPNACNACHSKRDAHWAAAQVRAWYGRDAQGHQQFAAAFRAADTGAVDAVAQLLKVAREPSQPAIARATALAGLGTRPSRAALEGLAEGLRDRDPVVRFGALQALSQAPQGTRASLAAPLLSDPVKSVRIEAASVLADVPADQLSAEQRAAFERAAGEYVGTQRYNADRAEGRVNLGTFYAKRGDAAKAEEELKAAIRLE
ncbi:MAG: cytochrome c3 family protein, partial [Dongiaceae bacterium]